MSRAHDRVWGPTPPDPVIVEEKCRQIIARVKAFEDRYKWGYGRAYYSGSGPETKGKMYDSDPTLGVMENKIRIKVRGHLTDAAGDLHDALSNLDTAHTIMDKVAPTVPVPSFADRRKAAPVRGEGSNLQDEYLTASQASESVEAQRRRRERGESWGQG